MPAEVVRVIDGDTIEVMASPWPDVTIRATVRLVGVNAPELRGKCEEEKAAAKAAAAFVEERIGGTRIWLVDPEPDPSFGTRTLARVLDAGGRDLAEALIAAGLGRPYEGGKREGWCHASESEP